MAVHSYSVSSLASLSLLDSLALSSAVNSLGWLSWEEGLSERELRACKRKKAWHEIHRMATLPEVCYWLFLLVAKPISCYYNHPRLFVQPVDLWLGVALRAGHDYTQAIFIDLIMMLLPRQKQEVGCIRNWQWHIYVACKWCMTKRYESSSHHRFKISKKSWKWQS